MTSLSTLDYVENFTITKSLNDKMWQLNFTLDKDEAPTPMTGIRAFATDHASVEHCLFVGFIPGAEYIRQIANDKVSITAYDFMWYLTAQDIPKMNWNYYMGGWNDITFLKRHIGGANSLNVTGLVWGENDGAPCSHLDGRGWFDFSNTTKMAAVEAVSKNCDKLFWIIFKDDGGGVYVPTIYYMREYNLEAHLPAIVTFTNPSVYVKNLKISQNSMEDYNRVVVYGTDPETGDWYTKTEETAEVTAGEEKPIEYVYSDVNLPSQATTDAKAASLYSVLHGISATYYTATLTNRYDLRLLQKVKFVGYSDIPEIEMKIISITYQRALNNDGVSITFTADQSCKNLKLLARYINNDPIQTQQQVINQTVQGIKHISVGEVTAIDGNIATITLERSGSTVSARILV